MLFTSATCDEAAADMATAVENGWCRRCCGNESRYDRVCKELEKIADYVRWESVTPLVLRVQAVGLYIDRQGLEIVP
jgi:23S rRNA C2498 (ribose-2'-O)-methylase RlmM